MKKSATLLTLIAGVGCSQLAIADDLSVISFGGANKDAQVKAYYEPFSKETGIKVVAGEYNGEMAKIKAMVESKSVSWDAVEVELSEVQRGCDEGLFEKIDYKVVGAKSDFLAGAAVKCGVGMFVWSTVMAYDSSKLKTAPTSWADFWDTKKFPGKRGLRKTAKYAVEAALQADGVKAADVYKVLATSEGVDRAFKKLDELKPNIQWWEAGAQAPQYLVSGDVVMTTAYNGRIANAIREGNASLKMAWDTNTYEQDYWAIPKGSPKKDLAMQFIASVVKPEKQVEYAKIIPYGPTNKKAAAMLAPELAAQLPTSANNMKNAVAIDAAFWLDHGEELERRFNAWAAK